MIAPEKHLCPRTSRHLLQFADDGSFGAATRFGRNSALRFGETLEIGDTYEDELLATEWTSIAGKKQPWGKIPLKFASIVSQISLDNWQPTSEEYQGYTGNAGNTLDRWYHRSAIVLWPKQHHYAVLAQAGYSTSIPLFTQLVSKLNKASEARKEAVRRQCIDFATAILAHWPTTSRRYRNSDATEKSHPLLAEFRDALEILNDPTTTVALLLQAASRDPALRLSSLISHGCREFGTPVLAEGLRALLTPPKTPYGSHEMPVRDSEWLAGVCDLPQSDLESQTLVHELCSMAIEWFCVPVSNAYYSEQCDAPREKTLAEAGLPDLCKALLCCGREESMNRVLRFVDSYPDRFSLEDGHVPALKKLVPWSVKKFGHPPAPLESWLSAVRRQLETATASVPQPPSDWTRKSNVSCQCRYCGQLKDFLMDRDAEVGRIPAREDMRSHVIQEIERQQLDVVHSLEKRGSPFTLVLKKTQASFQRRLKRYHLDKELLDALPNLQESHPRKSSLK